MPAGDRVEIFRSRQLTERIGSSRFQQPVAFEATGRFDDNQRFVRQRGQQLQYVALIKAETGDRWGNLTYRKTARNFGPIMAMAATLTIASVHEVVELGELDPEAIITPGIFVRRVVRVARTATGPAGFKQAA